MLLGKSYRNIEFEDIERLVENKIAENKSIEYKLELHIDKGEEKKEFLYDITSFVNSDGGAIIYGVSELKDEAGKNTGIPSNIIGLSVDNFDELIRKIEDVIKTGVEPNIPDIIIKPLQKDDNKLLIIGLPKTIGLPRMVTYNSTNKFYRRRNSGKYLIDVYEMNQMFKENSEIIEELDNFRLTRFEKVKKNEFILNVNSQNFTLIHVCPVSYFKYNTLSLSDENLLNAIRRRLVPIGASGWDYRHNFEGFLQYNFDLHEKLVASYTQVFRNGIIEFFTNGLHNTIDEKRVFYLGDLELQVIDSVKNSLQIYKDHEVSPPFAVNITLSDMLNRFVNIGQFFRINNSPFLLDNIFVPNVVINDFEDNIEKRLKGSFDIIWQSAGNKESPYYDVDGNRKFG